VSAYIDNTGDLVTNMYLQMYYADYLSCMMCIQNSHFLSLQIAVAKPAIQTDDFYLARDP
jgi:hypothetical protein